MNQAVLEIAIAGLGLFCVPGAPGCDESSATYYIVDARQPAEICGRQMNGMHRARLAFSADDVVAGGKWSPEHMVGPNGDAIAFVELNRDQVGCFRVRSTGEEELDFSMKRTGEIKASTSNSLGWLLSPGEFDDGVGGLLPPDELERRATVFEIPEGALRTSLSPALAEDLALVTTSVSSRQVPRAFAPSARLEVSSNNGEFVIEDCNTGEDLLRLRGSGRQIKATLSNEPPMTAMGDGFEHFLWAYSLFDYNGQQCPATVGLPTLVPPSALAIGGRWFCAPSGGCHCLNKSSKSYCGDSACGVTGE